METILKLKRAEKKHMLNLLDLDVYKKHDAENENFDLKRGDLFTPDTLWGGVWVVLGFIDTYNYKDPKTPNKEVIAGQLDYYMPHAHNRVVKNIMTFGISYKLKKLNR